MIRLFWCGCIRRILRNSACRPPSSKRDLNPHESLHWNLMVTLLAAARSLLGSNSPPDCYSIPRSRFATSVETPVPVLSLFTYLVYHRNQFKSSDFDSLFLFSSHLPPRLLSRWAVSFLSDMAKNYTALNKEELFLELRILMRKIP